ncbi:hypothetical protein [Tateyamaria sp. ANG-S1]|uniref:hypothetical protein n=1 Tax=Tateyamaria sp. ANG-S1 TaxID=1577905 RepID=UPI00057FD5FE|nr:hypothetical protein [Tateyamaria sp. ANG-S1]KIC49611.1 hypothetical protein RA29_08025 [Tateyamaria sp. ANG-S1]
MKRIQFAFVLAALTTVAACGGAQHYVARGDVAPISFAPYAQNYDDTTSQRAAIDLLSLG